MPRAILCEGCKRTHLIRDELIGHKIQCDCGRIQTAPDTAPYRRPPARGLDSCLMLGLSFVLLLGSLLVGGAVAAWVFVDHGATDNTAIAAAPERAGDRKGKTAAGAESQGKRPGEIRREATGEIRGKGTGSPPVA